MQRAICFLTVRPCIKFYDFCKKLQNDSYDVYICIDDSSYTIPGADGSVRLIKYDRPIVEKEGFKSSVMWFNNRACSRDKALYYFCKTGIEYNQVWFIEEDVFIPTEITISTIDTLYESADLLTSGHEIVHKFSSGWHWPHIINVNKIKIPLPYAHSMICAIRVSRALLTAIASYASKYANLFLDEALFNTLAMHEKLVILPIPELSTILWKHRWQHSQIRPTHLYHPVKDIDKQYALRLPYIPTCRTPLFLKRIATQPKPLAQLASPSLPSPSQSRPAPPKQLASPSQQSSSPSQTPRRKLPLLLKRCQNLMTP